MEKPRRIADTAKTILRWAGIIAACAAAAELIRILAWVCYDLGLPM